MKQSNYLVLDVSDFLLWIRHWKSKCRGGSLPWKGSLRVRWFLQDATKQQDHTRKAIGKSQHSRRFNKSLSLSIAQLKTHVYMRNSMPLKMFKDILPTVCLWKLSANGVYGRGKTLGQELQLQGRMLSYSHPSVCMAVINITTAGPCWKAALGWNLRKGSAAYIKFGIITGCLILRHFLPSAKEMSAHSSKWDFSYLSFCLKGQWTWLEMRQH